MPLRDHFRPPLDERRHWQGLHGQWPAMLVLDLSKRLPPRYVAEPQVRLGTTVEIDAATFGEEGEEQQEAFEPATHAEEGGVATAVWAPPRPTLSVKTSFPEQDEYEVRVFDKAPTLRLVAAVEIVSPANKNRPEHRRAFRAFVDKCLNLLVRGVSVALVDLVTSRQSNLYGELLASIGHEDPAHTPGQPPVYAAACRRRREPIGNGSERRPRGAPAWRLEAWAHALEIGRPLPTLPLWLADDLAVPLELEATYEETCRALRIA